MASRVAGPCARLPARSTPGAGAGTIGPVSMRERSRRRAADDATLVEELAGIGCTVPEIAAVCGCSEDTIETTFAAAVHRGRERAKASLRCLQWKAARAGNVTMLVWLGKQILGQ